MMQNSVKTQMLQVDMFQKQEHMNTIAEIVIYLGNETTVTIILLK